MSEEPEKPDIEVTEDDSSSAADMSKAYADLTGGLASAINAAAMQPVIDQFRQTIATQTDTASMLANLVPAYDLPDLAVNIPRELMSSPPPFEPIDFHSPTVDIAESTAEVAELMHRQHEAIAQLVALTATNLQHTESQRESAARTERFTRGMAWGSLAVAVASLAAAVVAIFR